MKRRIGAYRRCRNLLRGTLRATLLTAASLLMPGAALASSSYSAFDTAEYYASGGLAQIHADQAYALGYSGAGVTVAVFDTGIDPTHSEFAGKTIGGYDYIYDTASYLFDPNGHGTHVAGIVAADRNGKGMQGVAYGANIMSFDILYAANPLGAFFDGIDRMIADNVRIASNSWVTYIVRSDKAFVDELHSKLKNAEDHGVIFVFAAGNASDTKPWDPADIPEFLPNLQKQWIAVVAVDQNDKIASFSNRCGPDAAWCIAAPGVNITSTYPGGGYAEMSGTSMAAPFVSGALALVEQAFPYMTSQQMVQTILTTATHIGPADVYGRGLLDVGAAVRGPGSFDMNWSVDTAGYNSVWSNNIGGTGALTKSGLGILALDGRDTYSGRTTVAGGVLQIGDAGHKNASIARDVRVLAHGLLSGHGTINGNVANQGAVLPGGSIGTLAVNGNYTQNANAKLHVEIGPSATSELVVTGTASLDGTLSLLYDGGNYLASSNTLLSAGSIAGKFRAIVDTGAPNLQHYYTLTAKSFTLTMQPANDVVVSSLTTAAIDAAQRNAAQILSRAGLDPKDANADSNVWMKAQGQFDQYRSDAPGADFSTNDAAILAGIERRYDGGFKLGAAGGLTHIDLQQRGAQADGTADLYGALLYGGYDVGGATMSATAGYTEVRFQTHRSFLATSGTQKPSASYDGHIASAAVDVAKRWSSGTLSVTPEAGLQYANLQRDRGTETGSPAFDLAFASDNTDSLRPFVGVELSDAYLSDSGAQIVPTIRVGYSHELMSVRRDVMASLAGGSNALETASLSPARDIVTFGGGIEARIGSQLYLHADAEVGLPVGNHSSQMVSADLDYRF